MSRGWVGMSNRGRSRDYEVGRHEQVLRVARALLPNCETARSQVSVIFPVAAALGGSRFSHIGTVVAKKLHSLAGLEGYGRAFSGDCPTRFPMAEVDPSVPL
jgi:hypothetical protein